MHPQLLMQKGPIVVKPSPVLSSAAPCMGDSQRMRHASCQCAPSVTGAQWVRTVRGGFTLHASHVASIHLSLSVELTILFPGCTMSCISAQTDGT